MGCTSTAMPSADGCCADGRNGPTRRAESSTVCSTETNASQSRASRTESDRPAIKDVLVSTYREQEYGGTGSAATAARAGARPWRPSPQPRMA